MEKISKNKILILTTSFPKYENDTSSLFIHTLAKYLTNYNKVDLLCPAADGIPNKQVIDNINVTRFNYFIPGFQSLAYGIPEKYKKNWFQLPFLFFSFLLKAIRLGKNYDAINAHWLIPSGLIGAIVKSIYNKEFILTVHNTDVTLMNKLPFSKILTKFILKKADSVIAISNKSKIKLLKLTNNKYSNKIIVMPMGTNLVYKNMSKEGLRNKYNIRSNKVIMFLGRLIELKGLEYLIRSLSGIKDITLIVAGQGVEEDNLMKLANELNVNARFVGQVNGKIKKDYFLCSDLVVIPSIRLKDGREDGIPTVALEAMSLGIPVISSDASSLNEIIKHDYNGFLFKEKDHKGLRNIIINCFNNNKLKEIAKNGYETSRKFSIDKIGNSYNKILNQR